MPSEKITNGIKYIGKHIKPWHPIVGVAIAELFFRPLFTMMDKKASPEARKYAATREAITEVVAAGTYLASNAIAVKIAEAKYKNNPEKLVKAKHNLSLIGLWTAASLVIPALTSAAIKPLMGRVLKNGTNNDSPQPVKTVEVNNVQKPITPLRSPQNVSMTSYLSSGMRV